MRNIKQMWMLFFVIGIFPIYVCYGQEILKRKKVIIIDPGHGGTDAGAIGINGVKEKDMVLEIAKEILKWNKVLLNNRYDIYLTRYSDTLISLSHRTKLADVLHSDLFISLHGNNANNPNAKGIEVYIHNSVYIKNENKRQSTEIATYIMEQLNEKLGHKIRGVKKANFQVLRQTVNICPAILIELGFLSNKDEADYLTKKENINAVALTIMMSIKI